MGGYVNFTVRTPCGKEYRMGRWTNILPWAIDNLWTIEKNPDHVRAVLESWEDMKDDWEANHETGSYKYHMTPAYAPYDNELLYPCGYGLVVLDMVNNVILSSQGYCSFGNMSVSGISLSLSGNIIGEDDNDTTFLRFKRLFENGRISHVTYDDKAGHLKEENISDKSLDYVVNRIIHSWWQDSKSYRHFKIDMHPFVIEEYNDFDFDNHASRELKSRIIELGFDLSEKENKMWEKTISEVSE